MDTNKVWLVGTAVSSPVLTKMKHTPLAYFNLSVVEFFRSGDGNKSSKKNIIRINSIGKLAQDTHDRVSKGMRYAVEGYIRQDFHKGVTTFCVRAFSIIADPSATGEAHTNGMKEAITILEDSRDKDDALHRLQQMIEPSWRATYDKPKRPPSEIP